MEGVLVDTRNAAFENSGSGIQNTAPGGIVNSNSGNGFSFNSSHFHQAVTINQSNPQSSGPSKLGACLRSLSYGEIHHRFHDVKKAATGTCQWIFEYERFKAWASQDQALLWIKGKPGSGKSTLMRYILDHLETSLDLPNDALVLQFFFHGRGTELQKTPLGLFRSLLHQLRGISGALDDLVTSYEQKHETQGEPGQQWDWHPSELQAHFESSIEKALMVRPIWLFIDAVDESGHDNADDLVQILNELFESLQGKDVNQFHICFTCRHSPVLDFNPAFEICVEQENRHDISTFVKQKLSRIESQPGSVSAITKLVTARANGVFLWAELTSDVVRKQARQGLAANVIESTVDAVPEKLDDLYRGLIATMDAESLKLIQWICFARKPLTLAELKWAMAVEADCSHSSVQECGDTAKFPSDKENGKRRVHWLSRNLAELNSYGQVHFIHQSVRDFFIHKGLSALHDILASRNMLDTWSKANKRDSAVNIAHHRLLRICMACILKGETDCRVVDNTESLERYLYSVNSPLLSYAVLSFDSHLKICDSEGAIISDTLDILFRRWYSFRRRWAYLYQQWSSTFVHDGSFSLEQTLQSLNMTNSLQYLSTKGCHNLITDESGIELIEAVKAGDTVNVEMLLCNGVPFQTRDADGNTPLKFSIVNAHDDLIRLFLRCQGVKVDAKPRDNETVFLSAIRRGKDDIVELLLDYGIDMESTNLDGETPLLYAISSGAVSKTIRLLLVRGANTEAKDDKGATALHMAIAAHSTHATSLLLDYGANTEARNSIGQTPLHIAAADSKSQGCDHIRVLLDHGANVEAKDGEGATSLQIAIAAQSLASVTSLLLDYGADTEVKCVMNQTPLHVAVANWTFRLYDHILALLDHGANIEAKDKLLRTPLHRAVENWENMPFDTAHLLLFHGANTEAKNFRGRTPLHEAAAFGSGSTIFLALLESGADPKAKDILGQTPYDLAIDRGDTDMLDLSRPGTRESSVPMMRS